ncbi:hypothetical protein JMN32_19565 [Fulvivirga sp. 29W222]|uniref:Uncharacterized protein n=1 Tax=Fulvivirga marina TaxID=2494733 RepID=A0A937KFU0_9BACT|nr:hypothetical protein [Fulvivirga marina]MBL6448518.1 hypothetical protein [Fulvivirga marina]
MIKGIAEEAVAGNIISKHEMQQVVNDLYKTAEGGAFCYISFKIVGKKP